MCYFFIKTSRRERAMRRTEDVFKLSQKSMNRFESLDFCSHLRLLTHNQEKFSRYLARTSLERLGIYRRFLPRPFPVDDLDLHSRSPLYQDKNNPRIKRGVIISELYNLYRVAIVLTHLTRAKNNFHDDGLMPRIVHQFTGNCPKITSWASQCSFSHSRSLSGAPRVG